MWTGVFRAFDTAGEIRRLGQSKQNCYDDAVNVPKPEVFER